jgi:predicted RNA binding protein YcfA (HicA-like mRNA interferase family)
VPRLICTFRRFISIIESHGFVLHRSGATSHRRYKGVVDGQVRFVDVAAHNLNDEIRPGTLKSMIRQSGLSEKLFRN